MNKRAITFTSIGLAVLTYIVAGSNMVGYNPETVLFRYGDTGEFGAQGLRIIYSLIALFLPMIAKNKLPWLVPFVDDILRLFKFKETPLQATRPSGTLSSVQDAVCEIGRYAVNSNDEKLIKASSDMFGLVHNIAMSDVNEAKTEDKDAVKKAFIKKLEDVK